MNISGGNCGCDRLLAIRTEASGVNQSPLPILRKTGNTNRSVSSDTESSNAAAAASFLVQSHPPRACQSRNWPPPRPLQRIGTISCTVRARADESAQRVAAVDENASNTPRGLMQVSHRKYQLEQKERRSRVKIKIRIGGERTGGG